MSSDYTDKDREEWQAFVSRTPFDMSLSQFVHTKKVLADFVASIGLKPWPQDHVPEGCVLGPDGKPVCVRNPSQWARYSGGAAVYDERSLGCYLS